MKSLCDRFRIAPASWTQGRLQQTLAEVGARRLERLAARDHLHPSAPELELAFPPQLASMIEAAVAVAASEDEATTIVRHYTELMPGLLVDLLASTEAPSAPLIHVELEAARMPRLSATLRALESRLGGALTARALDGAEDAEGWWAGGGSLSARYPSVHFGRCMPPLYGFPHDFDAYNAEVASGATPLEVIDRRLTSPLLHELMHGGVERAPIPSMYLDECISGYLGVHIRPAFAFPPPDLDNGVFMAPRLAQVGQSLAAVYGREAVARAHLGLSAFEDVLGERLVEAIAELSWSLYLEGRELHFLSGLAHPQRWHKLFFLARFGELPSRISAGWLDALTWPDIPSPETPLDAEILEHGLRAMCLTRRLEGPCYRVSSAPPEQPILLDALAGTITLSSWEGEDAPEALLPPSLGARMRRRGEPRRVVWIGELDAIPERVRELLGSA